MKRQEFILNILLLGSIVVSFAATAITFFHSITQGKSYGGVPPILPVIIFAIFVLLYLFSKRGFYKVTAYSLIFLYLLPTLYAVMKWSIYLPEAPIVFALLIIMSGILIGTRFAFIITTGISITLYIFTHLQATSILPSDLSWMKGLTPEIVDVLMLNVTFFVITIVIWLYNREIHRSLERAYASERALAQERDALEITVEERTRELKQVEMEKMAQMYRFVEFGKLASGFFHDIVYPLTTVSLNLEELKVHSRSPQLKEAMYAARKMEGYIVAVRKQLQQQTTKKTFFLDREIQDVLKIFNVKAKMNRVSFVFNKEKISFYGNPNSFNKVITNIVGNAIDAYDVIADKRERLVVIDLFRKSEHVVIHITDHGKGISKSEKTKIFEPFFTTKTSSLGLGLSLCKTIVVEEFLGSLSVQSSSQKTTFIIQFPLHQKGILRGQKI